MAMESLALVLAPIGLVPSSRGQSASLPITGGFPFVGISCRMRPRNLGSQHKRQQAKKASPKRLPVKGNLQPHNGESEDSQNVTKIDRTVTSLGEKVLQISDNDDGEEGERQRRRDGGREFKNISLEALIDMIKNSERNILLLNQARVRALEDLDKILSEKEALQAEIYVLETKLAETDARIRVAVLENVNDELLGNQLEELKNEMPSRKLTGRGIVGDKISNIQSPESLSLDVVSLPLDEELSSLRNENSSLMDDIQTLKAKLSDIEQTEERVLMLEREKSLLESAVKELEFRLSFAQEDVTKLNIVRSECKALWEKVENLQELLDNATQQANQAVRVLEQNHELQRKVQKLEASWEDVNSEEVSSNKSERYSEQLQEKIRVLEERLQASDRESQSHVQLYQESVKEFQDMLSKLEEAKTEDLEQTVDDMPWEFWSHLLLTIDGWLLEKKISFKDAKLLREITWRRDRKIRDTFLACKGQNEQEAVEMLRKLVSPPTRTSLNIVHIAAEMAPIAKVGGLGDVVSGLSKALQRKGHLVEIILPKYDCIQYERITDLKAIDVNMESYFDGQLFKNKIWVGTVEGLPVYFVEPHHPARLFWRGQFYGEHDDFKRFSFFSRAALEFLHQSGKEPDIIHCHDWHTAFVAPLYWDQYVGKGFINSARICFTCHNFEYQGTTAASELSSCGLDVQRLNRPDRMQDNSAHDRINPLKGAIVYSNIVTTVSPTYAQEACTAEGGRGLQETLKRHGKKFAGILNGIDTEAWDPSRDPFLTFQYSADDLQGKAENKKALRKQLELSSLDAFQPLVGCITRLVPQKGVHLIRHAIYRTLELGGQFLLLGSSPVPRIQREFEDIAKHFQTHPHVRLILKYDEALSHSIYAASDLFIIPSMFEPCGLTQMIAMRYGSVPIVRRTGGLNDSVFDVDDNTIPFQYRNGFTFLTPNEEGLDGAMERAFDYYINRHEIWKQLVQKDMRIDFSWTSSAAEYEGLYQNAVARARAAESAV